MAYLNVEILSLTASKLVLKMHDLNVRLSVGTKGVG
jgi:hypothetical protein